MNRRTLVNLLLLIAILPLGEVHNLFSSGEQQIDVYLLIERKEYVQWVVKDICDAIAQILLAVLIYRLMPQKLKPCATVFLLYRTYELILYFINFKTYGYFIVYVAMALIISLPFFKLYETSRKSY